MNFLAHIYLSGENDLLKIGNFVSDVIRGKNYLDYPKEMQKGILLHREIDNFTDMHLTYRLSKHRLHEKYGHYSGVIMDIVYDHFLAKNFHKFSDVKLENYIQDFYKLLQEHHPILPDKIKRMMIHMMQQNWLLQYQSLTGLEIILNQMDYRTKHRVHMQEAIVEVQQFYAEFESEFFSFFAELQDFCVLKTAELHQNL
jgi:acyl carrier protein phosphodiesterase